MNKCAALLLLMLVSAAMSGCMTSKVVEKVCPPERTVFNPKTKKQERARSKPGYILVLPAAFAGDVVTAPLWLPLTFMVAGGLRG
ncbi:MAG TPA: hypothetical protein VG796_12295 [Verrucomicrobiales bacterium]|nr:hypothetical protein [Verrucomicrobiales bacterium]